VAAHTIPSASTVWSLARLIGTRSPKGRSPSPGEPRTDGLPSCCTPPPDLLYPHQDFKASLLIRSPFFFTQIRISVSAHLGRASPQHYPLCADFAVLPACNLEEPPPSPPRYAFFKRTPAQEVRCMT